MSNITLDEATLYYQYLINNNSTSTMLNAISGTETDSYDALSSLGAVSGYGELGSLSDFSSILELCLSQSDATQTSYEATMEAASMADKLSGVLEEAAQTEDTASLTYATVQELYEYFSEQVSSKASALMGTAETKQSEASVSGQSALSELADMNQAAMAGQEFDFSQIDELVDSVFTEKLPMV